MNQEWSAPPLLTHFDALSESWVQVPFLLCVSHRTGLGILRFRDLGTKLWDGKGELWVRGCRTVKWGELWDRGAVEWGNCGIGGVLWDGEALGKGGCGDGALSIVLSCPWQC